MGSAFGRSSLVSTLAVFALVVTAGCSTRHQRATTMASADAAAAASTVRRAAFDVGSGATKLRVADVIVGKHGLDTALEVTGGDEAVRVDYEVALNDSKACEFDERIQARGLEALARLKQIAVQAGAQQFAGVASGAFRAARNGRVFARRIRDELGIDLRVATPEEEAQLGYYAAQDSCDFDPKDLVVWDIGAADLFFTMLEGQKLRTYSGSMASVTLRDTVIRVIQGKPGARTPNPMSAADLDAVLELVQGEARESVPRDIVERLRRRGTTVVGIGPVHWYSVRGQVGTGERYTIEQVEQALRDRSSLGDEAIGGEYADTQIVNLALVAGYMRALNIREVVAMNVNLADGVLIDPASWPVRALAPSR